MDLPQWMFDAVTCCALRLMPTPVVSCEALAAPKVLIERRGDSQSASFVEARHLNPSLLGDADAKLTEDHNCQWQSIPLATPVRWAALSAPLTE